MLGGSETDNRSLQVVEKSHWCLGVVSVEIRSGTVTTAIMPLSYRPLFLA
jgi:hypothetical protein